MRTVPNIFFLVPKSDLPEQGPRQKPDCLPLEMLPELLLSTFFLKVLPRGRAVAWCYNIVELIC